MRPDSPILNLPAQTASAAEIMQVRVDLVRCLEDLDRLGIPAVAEHVCLAIDRIDAACAKRDCEEATSRLSIAETT